MLVRGLEELEISVGTPKIEFMPKHTLKGWNDAKILLAMVPSKDRKRRNVVTQ